MHGDQYARGRGQRGHGQEAELRWAIDNDDIIVALDAIERVTDSREKSARAATLDRCRRLVLELHEFEVARE